MIQIVAWGMRSENWGSEVSNIVMITLNYRLLTFSDGDSYWTKCTP